MKVKGKVLKAWGRFEEGKTYDFNDSTFRELEKGGFVEKAKAKAGRPKKTED
jgi:hypothetical protein